MTDKDSTGLRSTYRLKGTEEVVTQDFFGPTKGEDSAAFLGAVLGQEDFNVTSVIIVE